MNSQRQRDAARSFAVATFTKYPRWFDDKRCEWRAVAGEPPHPLYEIARKQAWMRDQRKYSPPEAQVEMPPTWTGRRGWYDLLRFIDVYLPPRPPDHHLLAARHDDGGPIFYWKYAEPRRATIYGSERAAMNFERYGDAPERTNFEPLPAGYFDAHPPRRPAWEEAGFVMPEGGAERYVCSWPFYDTRPLWQID